MVSVQAHHGRHRPDLHTMMIKTRNNIAVVALGRIHRSNKAVMVAAWNSDPCDGRLPYHTHPARARARAPARACGICIIARSCACGNRTFAGGRLSARAYRTVPVSTGNDPVRPGK